MLILVIDLGDSRVLLQIASILLLVQWRDSLDKIVVVCSVTTHVITPVLTGTLTGTNLKIWSRTANILCNSYF